MYKTATCVVAFAALALPLMAQAQVYRCEDAGGQTVFSQRPCGPDAEVVEVGPTNSSDPMSDAMRRELSKQERRSRLSALESQERALRAQGDRQLCEIARGGVKDIERIWNNYKVSGYSPDDERAYQKARREAQARVTQYCR
jgi:hypothetical protein